MWYVFFTLIGLAVGSFLNVVIDRLPTRKSLVSPPSHCDACGRPLAFLDLIPVFSYLILRGRCRYCRATIPLRTLLVEIGGGALFLLAYWRFGLTAEFAITALWCCVFLVIIFIDWEHKLILNRVVYPAVVAGLIILAIDTPFPDWDLLTYIKSFWPESGVLSIDILNGIIGGAIGFIFFLIIHIIMPQGLGIGDVKLAFLIGLVTGVPLMIVALLLGILSGGVVAVILVLFFKKGRKTAVPYGTLLAIGPIVTLLWGNEIFNWYLGFF